MFSLLVPDVLRLLALEYMSPCDYLCWAEAWPPLREVLPPVQSHDEWVMCVVSTGTARQVQALYRARTKPWSRWAHWAGFLARSSQTEWPPFFCLPHAMRPSDARPFVGTDAHLDRLIKRRLLCLHHVLTNADALRWFCARKCVDLFVNDRFYSEWALAEVITEAAFRKALNHFISVTAKQLLLDRTFIGRSYLERLVQYFTRRFEQIGAHTWDGITYDYFVHPDETFYTNFFDELGEWK